MNNSIHLNLLRFELLSRESETEHHAACSAVVVDWSAPVVKSIFGIGSLHVKCYLNASRPYWETSDNDAVHVKSPAVCRATLQSDRIASRLSTIRRWPTRPLTDCCMPHHPPLSPQRSRWHGQTIVQWLSQPMCCITTSPVLNN